MSCHIGDLETHIGFLKDHTREVFERLEGYHFDRDLSDSLKITTDQNNLVTTSRLLHLLLLSSKLIGLVTTARL